jgi:hypothetical protein
MRIESLNGGAARRRSPLNGACSITWLVGAGVLSALLAGGCHEAPADWDVSNVPGLRPGDIEHCARDMSRDLLEELVYRRSKTPDGPVCRIGIAGVENHTNEPFVGESREMVVQRIQTILFRALRRQQRETGNEVAKFITLRESVRREIERQRTVKQVAQETRGRLRDVAGADYILTGVYRALDKYADGKRLIDMYLTFELIDADTAELAWTHDYPVKTVTGG